MKNVKTTFLCPSLQIHHHYHKAIMYFPLFSQALLLRVNGTLRLIRRVELFPPPESVEHLQNELWEKLQLEGGFSLQYEDPNFDDGLSNLVDIAELPTERAVLHILWDKDISAVDRWQTVQCFSFPLHLLLRHGQHQLPWLPKQLLFI